MIVRIMAVPMRLTPKISFLSPPQPMNAHFSRFCESFPPVFMVCSVTPTLLHDSKAHEVLRNKGLSNDEAVHFAQLHGAFSCASHTC